MADLNLSVLLNAANFSLLFINDNENADWWDVSITSVFSSKISGYEIF